ncbi:MAG: PTS sugar transporter subunit IIC [Longicatena sp.]
MLNAILVALIAGIGKIDNRLFGMTMIQRPLIMSTLVGIVYGDVTTGLLLGAQIELLSMGLVGIGAHSGMPDITIGSALCTAFALSSGTGTEVALALSLPVSTFALMIGYLTWIPLNHMLSERSKIAAQSADIKTMERCQWLGLFNYFFFPFLVVLIGMIAGVPVFEYLIQVIPTWITDGIKTASGMLPALGFALLMQLTFSWKMAAYLFVGFVAVAFFGLSNVGVAIIGGILAAFAFNSGNSDGIKGVESDEI